MPTAVVIDGAFFLRRFRPSISPTDTNGHWVLAGGVANLVNFHMIERLYATPSWSIIDAKTAGRFRADESGELYRVFFYDCEPLTKKMHSPVSKKALDLAKSPEAILRRNFHNELRRMRKVALRLGSLNEGLSGWKPRPEAVKRWMTDPENFSPTDDDFQLDVVQKGVDMRLGLDIASMAFKRQVDQIVIVAGDADFIPVAKLARREGIDVILDPMGAHVPAQLEEHVDGIRHSTHSDG